MSETSFTFEEYLTNPQLKFQLRLRSKYHGQSRSEYNQGLIHVPRDRDHAENQRALPFFGFMEARPLSRTVIRTMS